MALELSDTEYTPVNARVVQDRTALRALEVAAPAIEQGVVGYAEGKVRGEMAALQGSLQQTRNYINSLRAKQEALDPSDAESLIASEDLAREIDRTIKGQTQGMMNASQAESRISAKVRELSRRFPVAAPALRTFVSPGSSYATAEAMASDLAAEEARALAIQKTKDAAMVRYGLNPQNPVAVANFDLAMREQRILEKRRDLAQTLSAELALEAAQRRAERRPITEAQEDLTYGRAVLGFTREAEQLAEDRRARRVSAEQRELQSLTEATVLPTTTDRVIELVNSAPMQNGKYTDPESLKAGVMGIFNAARTLYAQEIAGTGIDGSEFRASLSDLQSQYIAMIDSDTLTGFLNSQREMMEAVGNYNFIKTLPQTAILTNLFGPDFMERYAQAKVLGGAELERFEETFSLKSVQELALKLDRWQNNELKEEEIDNLSYEGSENPFGNLSDLSAKRGQMGREAISWRSVYSNLPLGRSTRWWKGQGAATAREHPEDLRNYFESEIVSLANSAEVTAVVDAGYTFNYDQNTKTLIMLDDTGNYLQHYTIPQGRTNSQRQALDTRVNKMLGNVQGYGQQEQEVVVPGETSIVVPPRQRTELTENSMRRIAEQLETLKVHKGLIPDFNQENYFVQLRTIGRQ